MFDADHIVEGLGLQGCMAEAVRGAFGALFGAQPRRPIFPLVDWIVNISSLPRTQVDNYVRSRRTDPEIARALNGDESSRCSIVRKIASAMGIRAFDEAFTERDILEIVDKSGPLAESSCFRPGIHKPPEFHRRRKERSPQENLAKRTLPEWLVSRCALPAEAVKSYLAGHAGDETVRMANAGDYMSRHMVARDIGKSLGIPEFDEAATLYEIEKACRKNRERKAAKASGENPDAAQAENHGP